MKEKLNSIRNRILLLVITLLSITAVSTTFAWNTWNLSVVNQLQAHSMDVQIVEDFAPATGKKIVSFVNNGSASVFLRISYAEYWESKNGTDKQILSNTIQDGSEIAIKQWTDYWVNGSLSEWDGGDGWYYYTKILKSGKETEDILTSVSFLNPLPKGYKREYYNLFFKVEAVQCSDGSSTLNSDEVNYEVLNNIFHKIPSEIDLENGTVIW